MNGELLAVLEHMEREKGIKKDILIDAVEQALASAVRKIADIKPGIEVKVTLDRETGKLKAFAGEEEIRSEGLGRIAASTAKQVIIQKIREAEKDVIFNEFNAKVGEIISGTLYRFEKGNIIVDLMGKAEGVLSKRDQIPGEEFHQGQRISAYLTEVKREARGAQIILSRSHPSFVKKIFEREVPEIYEGVVEIRSISRSAGERTKIAVWSKDEKIDAVGSCVGMRGARVKNIVNELHGERIDIVRYSDDAHAYISASLSPAEIAEIKLDKENKKALVIVNPDQLSLAIGKHGQNVRLASKLTGWDLDIRTKETILAKEQAKEETVVQKAEEPKPQGLSLDELSGVGEKTKAALIEQGFADVQSVAGSALEALVEVKGIGKAKAKKLIEEAKKLLKKL
ncbi:MAG: transcription termination factor NusA [Candidatus Omnitrophota bacterium]|nr:transcription termination factor NusA [Candidatus Omnitrophota bacterium]